MTAGVIDIWLVDLDACEAALLALDAEANLLAPSERARADSMHDALVAARWKATRVALHLALRSRIRRVVEFEADASAAGKPRVRGWPGDFSLTHSGALAAIAIGDRPPIGIDLEVPRTVRMDQRRRDLIEASARALAEGGLPSGGPGDEDFLWCWTSLEAVAKATGFGMGNLLARLDITGAPGGIADVELQARALKRDAFDGLEIAPLDLGIPGVAAALSWPRGDRPQPVRHLPADPSSLRTIWLTLPE